MKTTLSILAGATLLLAALTNRTTVNADLNSTQNDVANLNTSINKGSYLASEFAQFKKENIPEDRNIVEPVSEKVLFKAFVIHKKAQ